MRGPAAAIAGSERAGAMVVRTLFKMAVMSVSVQVVNGVYGLAAAGLAVRLDRADGGGWTEVARAKTDDDGHVSTWQSAIDSPGAYRLEFGTDSYFTSLGITPFYPVVTVEFRLPDPGYPHQVRLLLTPWSFLAYWQR